MKLVKTFNNNLDLTVITLTVVVLLLIVITVGGLIIGVNYLNTRTCNNIQIMTGLETTYIDFDACYVKKTDGTIVRYNGGTIIPI